MTAYPCDLHQIAEWLARADGWRAPNSAHIRARRDIVDLCPNHRGAQQ